MKKLLIVLACCTALTAFAGHHGGFFGHGGPGFGPGFGPGPGCCGPRGGFYGPCHRGGFYGPCHRGWDGNQFGMLCAAAAVGGLVQAAVAQPVVIEQPVVAVAQPVDQPVAIATPVATAFPGPGVQEVVAAAPVTQDGHYEYVTVQVWVEGHWISNGYATSWVPGHYENQTKSIWIAPAIL